VTMDGLTVTVGGAGLVAIGGVLVKLADVLMHSRNGKVNGNGYVKLAECDKQQIRMAARFDRVDAEISDLHNKANDTRAMVSEMKGFVEAKLG